MKKGKLTAVVPVRAGSQRVKDKNIKPFANSNLLKIKLNIKKTSSKKAILTVLEELAIDIKSQLRDDTDLGSRDLPNDDEPF